jgi:hypothetical protein
MTLTNYGSYPRGRSSSFETWLSMNASTLANKMNINPGSTSKNDDGADLVGLDFLDEGTRFTITGSYIR